MISMKSKFSAGLLGATFLFALGLPASAGPLSVASGTALATPAPLVDVAYKKKARHAKRHRVVKHRRYAHRRYVRRHYRSGVPAAAFGLFAGALGAAIASNSYDDYYYPYGYGYYPSYSYSYGGGYYPRYYGGGRGRHVYYNRPGHYRGVVRHGGFRGGYAGGGRHFGGGHYAGGGQRMGRTH